MAAAQRPYFSSSIDDLEVLFAARSQDLRVLTELVQELSLRKTNKARRLLALAAERLADHEPDADGSVEGISDDDDLPSSEKDSHLLNNKKVEAATRNHTKNAPFSSPSTYDAVASDQPPDDRKRPERLSRVRPLGTPALPAPWIRPLRADLLLDVDVDADLPQIYAAALAGLITEIKSTGAGQKRYELGNGIRVEDEKAVYEFSFADEPDLFEDAVVEVEVFGRRIHASIVSISSGRLFLATDEDLGRVLEHVVLLVDATALLEALKQKIEEAYKGEVSLNRDIADAVVGNKQLPVDPAPIPVAPSDRKLDLAQTKALRRALTASVSYIWGPPGCGKTRVLGEIVHSSFEAGKRILVCSNTNKAVDQVLHAICRSFREEHRAMADGHIVRLGPIADEKLKADFNAYVTVDGILERRSTELRARVNQINTELERIEQRCVQRERCSPNSFKSTMRKRIAKFS